jgi:hypothetical protein
MDEIREGSVMTNEQINIAIAEACGWKREFDGNHEEPEWYWIPPNNPDGDGEPPDYCNDLNAMHEAVTTLPENKWVLYGVRLAWECGHTDKKSVGLWHISTATAYHRAVALSRTLGKWEE